MESAVPVARTGGEPAVHPMFTSGERFAGLRRLSSSAGCGADSVQSREAFLVLVQWAKWGI
jgi:hypothetical protein